MNAKRMKYTTLAAPNIKEELVLVHDPNAGPGEPQYTYATIRTDHADVVDASSLHEHEQHLEHGEVEELTSDNEVIIDEHGRAVTFQQLVTDDGNSIQEVEAIEDEDGTTILQIVPSTHSEGSMSEMPVNIEGEAEEGEYINNDLNSQTSHLRSKNFYCPNCGNCYSAAGSLKLHMRACMRQRPEVPPEERQCHICKKIFNSISYLREHMMRHTGEGPRRCERCYRKFIDENKYKLHIEQHKEQDKLDAEAEELSKRNGGKKIIVKKFTCSFCSEQFTVVFDVGEVKRRYACDTCRDKYSNAEQLKRHKQGADDKRDFACERCGRKFVFEGFLQRHMPTCDGTIKRRRDLK